MESAGEQRTGSTTAAGSPGGGHVARAEPCSTEEWIAAGVELLELRRFHDAHHAFEQPWRHHLTPLRPLCQALVQVAAAGHHLSRGRRQVVATLIRRALPKLAGFVPEAAGLRLDRLVTDLELLAEQVADPAAPALDELRWPRVERATPPGGGDAGRLTPESGPAPR